MNAKGVPTPVLSADGQRLNFTTADTDETALRISGSEYPLNRGYLDPKGP